MLQHPVITRDPEIMGGTPVFMGTRVPIKTLFDYLQGGTPCPNFWTTSRRYARSKRWNC